MLADFEAKVLNNPRYASRMVDTVTVHIYPDKVMNNATGAFEEPDPNNPTVYTVKAVVAEWVAGGSMFGVQFEDIKVEENAPRAYIVAGTPKNIADDTPVPIRTADGTMQATRFIDGDTEYIVTRIWDYGRHGNYQLLFCVESTPETPSNDTDLF